MWQHSTQANPLYETNNMMTVKTLLLAFAAVILVVGVASPARAATSCQPLNLTITPNIAEELQPVTIANSVTNCSQSPQVIKVNVTFSASDSCWNNSESFSFKVFLRAGKSRTISFMLPAPPCDGIYTVTEASSNGGSATASLTVN